MLFPEHFLTVRATVTPEREADFNRWYNAEHTPDAVKTCKGCIGGARYKVVEGEAEPGGAGGLPDPDGALPPSRPVRAIRPA